jgi:hypothetical protein
MFTTAEKSNATRVNRQQQNAGTTFFRKAGDDAFFGGTQESSFFSPTIQAKLSVSSPDDPQEKEADAVADQVMRMPDPVSAPMTGRQDDTMQRMEEAPVETIQAKANHPLISTIQCKEEEESVQAKLFTPVQRSAFSDYDTGAGMISEGSSSGSDINRKHSSLYHSDVIQRSGRGPPTGSMQFEHSLSSSKGGGSALPNDTRQFMENRFNADFSGVRVHTGSHAQGLSTQIHAQAFTHGNDIYFNSGKYAPHTSGGSLLLAHELTHTIQQGASRTNTSYTTSTNTVARKPIIQRSYGAPVSQLDNAIQNAKSQEGKINAAKEGPDGNRTGWEQLVEIFKSTFGEDKIISGSGGTSVPGTVAEQDIKKKRTAEGVEIVDPAHTDRTMTGDRDAMPSWCGIFVFWALNKSGVPMPKWKLGQNVLKPESLNPPGYMPKPGDIAWRNAYSHFAIVESVNGDTVRTVNGNTAGEDNLGGQVQSREHPISNWTAFFNPLATMEGTLGSGQGPVNAKPKTFSELRKELSKVNRKEDGDQDDGGMTHADEHTIQPKSEHSTWSVDGHGQLQTGQPAPANINNTVQAKEEEKKQEDDKAGAIQQTVVQKQHETAIHCKEDCCDGEEHTVQPKHEGGLNTDFSASSLSSSVSTGAATVQASEGRGPPAIARSEEEQVQRSVIDDALSYIGSVTDCISIDLDEAKACALQKAQQVALHIPGYRALRVVLGQDPITGDHIERNGRNFIEAAFDIMPGGELLHRKLDEQHQLDAAAAWIDEQISRVESIVNGLFSNIERFFNGLGITDLGSPMDVLSDAANIVFGFIDRIIDFAVEAATELLEMIKEYLLTKIVDFIKEQTNAYALLTVILGKDPITEQEVERNGTNILNALLDLGGEEGNQQRTQMQETGTFQKVVDYIDEGIAIFSGAYEEIVQGFKNIWDVVSIDSLMDPSGTFTLIYNQFAAPVIRVLDFVVRVGAEILKFIKEVLMQRLSAWAKQQRGYELVTVIIEKDPFTNEVVPRSMENIIKGFMSLMEGGREQFEQLKESGAIGRTVAKINAAVARLNMTPASVVQLFIDLWNSFSLSDLANPPSAFRRIIDTFGEPIGRLINFVIEIVKIVVEAILIVMNFPFDLINNIITKAMQAFEMIKRDPVGFLKNLLRAIKQGFIQFFDNILQHLLTGLVGWLTSELRDAGVPAFTDTSLRGIISWVLEVLGISMEKIWEKLAAHPRIGPEKVARIRSAINTLEGIWTFIKDVQERGMAAIWDKIQEQLSNLWDTIIDAVKNWIMEQIVTRMVTRLLSMLDPTGIMAVINSAIALYSAIQSFIKYLREMLEIVNSFVEGVVDIASGNITTAANYLERTLARAVPIIIGFLANQVGLSGIGRRIGEMIGRAQVMVDEALTWLVNKCVDTAFSMLDRVMGALSGGGDRAQTGEQSLEERYGPEKAARIRAGLQAIEAAEAPLLTSGKIAREEAEQVATDVKRNHPVFTSLIVVDGGSKWNYRYTASEATDVDGKQKDPAGTGEMRQRAQDAGLTGVTLDHIQRASNEFGNELFSSTQLATLLGIHQNNALNHIRSWRSVSLCIMFSTSDRGDTETQYTFDLAHSPDREAARRTGETDYDQLIEKYRTIFREILNVNTLEWDTTWADNVKSQRIDTYRRNFRDQTVTKYLDSLHDLDQDVIQSGHIPAELNAVKGVIFEEWLERKGVMRRTPRPVFLKDYHKTKKLTRDRDADGYSGTTLTEAKTMTEDRGPSGDEQAQMRDYKQILIEPKIPWVRSLTNKEEFSKVEYQFTRDSVKNIWINDLRTNIGGTLFDAVVQP